jgi:hypothetical protein
MRTPSSGKISRSSKNKKVKKSNNCNQASETQAQKTAVKSKSKQSLALEKIL